MNYNIEYEDDKPYKVRFRPSWTDSKGSYHALLGKELFGRYCKDWTLDRNETIWHYLKYDPMAPKSSTEELCEIVQRDITKMMDRAMEVRNILHALMKVDTHTQANLKHLLG